MSTETITNGEQVAATEDPPKPKVRRGFAAMDPEKQRELARQGGRKAHASGNGRKFTTDEARAAGTKGGRTVSQDREHMRKIGSKGGWICAQDPAHMSAIGRKGGTKTAQSRAHMAEIGRKGAASLHSKGKADPATSTAEE
jgi:general stress protein YciG